ncbi:MAG: hypothetical protein ACR2KY_01295 [Thermoleophilaceae bacterium]
MTDFLDQTRTDIDKRLKELRPLHEEFLKLERAKSALKGIEAPRRGPGRPRGSTRGRSANGRGRRRRGGTRAEQTLSAVRQNPGITVADLSDRLKVKHKNYLYRVLAGLQSEGAVKKEGRGYVAT